MLTNAKHRPSPSLVVAVLALVVAAAGTAYAVDKLSGKSLKKGSTPGNRLKADTVKGKQVKEATLADVPRALEADRATSAADAETVGGITVRRFAVRLASDQGQTELFTIGDVTLRGRCEFGAPGQHGMQAAARPGAPSMVAAVTATDTAADLTEAFKTRSFSVLDLTAPGAAPQATIGHFIATATTGRVTEVSYLAASAPNFEPEEEVCFFSGTATSG